MGMGMGMGLGIYSLPPLRMYMHVVSFLSSSSSVGEFSRFYKIYAQKSLLRLQFIAFS